MLGLLVCFLSYNLDGIACFFLFTSIAFAARGSWWSVMGWLSYRERCEGVWAGMMKELEIERERKSERERGEETVSSLQWKCSISMYEDITKPVTLALCLVDGYVNRSDKNNNNSNNNGQQNSLRFSDAFAEQESDICSMSFSVLPKWRNNTDKKESIRRA